ncbi:MAG: hypothetical protein IJO06_02950 [Thermoguttaceae bacterium]|nr:hypothetical protein [Thermoguttaceae bacterium]
MIKFELSDNERICVRDILGYLNFSTGSRDVRFASAWNALYRALAERGSIEIWRDALDLLRTELAALAENVDAFRDSRQATRILDSVEEALSEYRIFHRDSLFHQKNEFLFNSLFMARICRLTTARDLFGDDGDLVADVVRQANDFLGYRPIPVLEGEERHEPNEREWISLVPLYYEGVGAAFGPYREVVEKTLEILRSTDSDLLREASFDPDKLRELALDPRAYDFDHPVNRRPNYSFGTWDDRCIDENGYYRRFVVHQTTLDAIMARVWDEKDETLRTQYVYEAAAVTAGTILMASGVSGGCVQAHDSTVTLSTLMPSIAAYRDAFYDRLILRVPNREHRERLTAEAARLFQPFAGARQSLNRSLAKRRADQLQRFSLARTFARMGYFEEARLQAQIIETPSARILSRIDSLITKAHLAADAGRVADGAKCVEEIEELLRRGLACGAFPDPWSILGFGAQYSLFTGVDSVVHDHRLDGFINLLNDIFDLYSRLQKEAAAAGEVDLRVDLSDKMSDLAGWWDQFGSDESSSVEGFSGLAVWESAAKVSTALAGWRQAGGAVGDVAFWRRHVERFSSPKAFVLLAEALLDKDDLISSSSLLIYWLNQSETIPLTEGDYSFHTIAFSWIEQVWSEPGAAEKERGASGTRRSETFGAELTQDEYLRRWNLTKTFLDRVEANAGENWTIPTLRLDPDRFDKKITFQTENPVLADLARRLILATKFAGYSSLGVPKLVVKAAFKDAARAVDVENLPSPEEFERFYRDNANVFPKFLTYRVFMQIVLNELRLTPAVRRRYQESVFGFGKTISVSDARLSADAGKTSREKDDAPTTAEEENERRKKELWAEMIQMFEASGDPDAVAAAKEMRESDGLDPNAVEKLARRLARDWEGSGNEENDEEFASQNERATKNGPTARDASNGKADGDARAASASVEFETFDDSNDYDDYDDAWDGDDEDDDKRGIDPLYGAAYDNMTFRDSAEDGIDDDVVEGKGAKFNDEGDDYEFAQETDRVNELLSFVYSTAKLWKFAAGKSPILRGAATSAPIEPFDDETLSDARLRLEGWLAQANIFERDLYELLDQASRFRIPKPNGTADGLAAYDQLRGTKEILLDRVIWTIVEVEDAIVFLKAALRDETSEKYAKPWKSKALETFGAMLRVDSKRTRRVWPELIARLENETLLYIPTSRGGDAKAIVDCRRLQQVVTRLFEYAPRLGLFVETFELLRCVQKMEQARLSAPGSITEFDRLVETATRGLTETLAESSKYWRLRSDSRFASNDEALIAYLEQTMDALLSRWLAHSQHIRISSVEAISTPGQWHALKAFIQEYGADLFTQSFLNFRNIRAILHQGTRVYLTTLCELKQENNDVEFGDKLASRIVDGNESLERAASLLEIALECVAENYTEYVDYNSTTTQSDRGEKLYMLLDFLRVLAKYERIAWNLKPVYWVHDALIRAGRRDAAELWKRNVKTKSAELSQESLRNYNRLTEQYGICLQSVRERLSERFVRPLDVAQMCGLVFDAISEARRGDESNPTFQELKRQIEEFAKAPSGAGFETPEWLNALQDEVVASRVDSKEERRERETKTDAFNPTPVFPIVRLPRDEVERQLRRAADELSADD